MILLKFDAGELYEELLSHIDFPIDWAVSMTTLCNSINTQSYHSTIFNMITNASTVSAKECNSEKIFTDFRQP
jgi:hypothetical protein